MPTKKTLTIRDNGIGMSREEAVSHLGTIARSGTAEFFKKLSGDQQKDSQLIGQFGVGFYSAFIVADRVEVLTRRAGLPASEGVHWESAADGDFTVETVERAERGTTIVLHLKEDAKEFLDAWHLRSLVRRYSDHIAFPVRMPKEGEATVEYEAVNRGTALWARPKGEIKDEEYVEFYRHLTHDSGEPLTWSHNRVEGKRDYTSLVYIPGAAPFDLWQRDGARGLKLYVRRVFIMDDAEQFLPLYLRFVKGVLDSADLPLNVSRELLQSDSEVEAMRAALTKRVLDLLAKLAKDDAAKYQGFWNEFGAVLKEGLAEDHGNRDKLLPLLRFASTHKEGDAEEVSLADYVARMQTGQDKIYYVVGESFAAARSHPAIEGLRARNVEVLLLGRAHRRLGHGPPAGLRRQAVQGRDAWRPRSRCARERRREGKGRGATQGKRTAAQAGQGCARRARFGGSRQHAAQGFRRGAGGGRARHVRAVAACAGSGRTEGAVGQAGARAECRPSPGEVPGASRRRRRLRRARAGASSSRRCSPKVRSFPIPARSFSGSTACGRDFEQRRSSSANVI